MVVITEVVDAPDLVRFIASRTAVAVNTPINSNNNKIQNRTTRDDRLHFFCFDLK